MAAANNISILATGGRHGYTSTLGDLQGGLAVDLSQLDTIEIDSSAKTLTAGPGVKVDAVMDPVYEAGFLIRKFRKHYTK
jgi:FAD/FMN-containing dehydrogenase